MVQARRFWTKETPLVDTWDTSPWVAHSAGPQDRDGVKSLLQKAFWFDWLRIIWAEEGYAGQLEHWFQELRVGCAAGLEIVRKLTPGFKLLPHRWVVERIFAWLSRCRRLSRDYEVKTAHSEASSTASRHRLRRLASNASPDFLHSLSEFDDLQAQTVCGLQCGQIFSGVPWA